MVIEKIKSEIKNAMISKDEVKKNTLKQVLNKANAEAKEISLKKGSNVEDELTDEVCINAINKEIKQLDQTISLLEDKKASQEKEDEKARAEGKEVVKRQDPTDSELYRNSVTSKEILKEYLPKQLTEEELENVIRNILKDIDVTNKGLVMKTVMGELKGKADGKLINIIANKVAKEIAENK